MPEPSVWREAFRDSAPVFFGYLPLGMAFGVLFSSLGYHWLYAPLSGLVVYAGSAQFLAVALLGAGAGLAETFFATLLLNARHVFYGLSVIDRYPKHGWLRWYLIFGLTDETYALVTSKKRVGRDPDASYYGALTVLNQSYWVLGCGLGALMQHWAAFDARGFEFALVALFLVLLIEQLRSFMHPRLLVAAVVVSMVLAALLGKDFLLLACALCLGVVVVDYRRLPHHV